MGARERSHPPAVDRPAIVISILLACASRPPVESPSAGPTDFAVAALEERAVFDVTEGVVRFADASRRCARRARAKGGRRTRCRSALEGDRGHGHAVARMARRPAQWAGDCAPRRRRRFRSTRQSPNRATRSRSGGCPAPRARVHSRRCPRSRSCPDGVVLLLPRGASPPGLMLEAPIDPRRLAAWSKGFRPGAFVQRVARAGSLRQSVLLAAPGGARARRRRAEGCRAHVRRDARSPGSTDGGGGDARDPRRGRGGGDVRDRGRRSVRGRDRRYGALGGPEGARVALGRGGRRRIAARRGNRESTHRGADARRYHAPAVRLARDGRHVARRRARGLRLPATDLAGARRMGEGCARVRAGVRACALDAPRDRVDPHGRVPDHPPGGRRRRHRDPARGDAPLGDAPQRRTHDVRIRGQSGRGRIAGATSIAASNDSTKRRTRALRRSSTARISFLSGLDPAEPFFAWLLPFDPHQPYEAPGAGRDRFLPSERPVHRRRARLRVPGGALVGPARSERPAHGARDGRASRAVRRGGRLPRWRARSALREALGARPRHGHNRRRHGGPRGVVRCARRDRTRRARLRRDDARAVVDEGAGRHRRSRNRGGVDGCGGADNRVTARSSHPLHGGRHVQSFPRGPRRLGSRARRAPSPTRTTAGETSC